MSLYHDLRALVIRDSEIAYLAGRHNHHRKVRPHIRHGRRIVRYHRDAPMSALLGWAAIALLIYTLV